MDTARRIRELLLKARDIEQEADGCRAEVGRPILVAEPKRPEDRPAE